jgi:pyrroline-5-carboxylate reductase
MAITHLMVGAGKMGGALLSGWISQGLVKPKQLAILDPTPGLAAVHAIESGAKHLDSAKDIPKTVETVVLSIKPQMFDTLSPALSANLPVKARVISILAGTSLRHMRPALSGRTVIRAMPNTPAAIGAGISAIFADPNLEAADLAEAERLLSASGKVVGVDSEAALNAVTALSGSGPAYVFHLTEAMAAAGRNIGLPDDVADSLARETIIGAAKLMEASDDTPEALRRNVTSPNGTTQAALDELMGESGLGPLMQRAIRAAFARAKELSGS